MKIETFEKKKYNLIINILLLKLRKINKIIKLLEIKSKKHFIL